MQAPTAVRSDARRLQAASLAESEGLGPLLDPCPGEGDLLQLPPHQSSALHSPPLLRAPGAGLAALVRLAQGCQRHRTAEVAERAALVPPRAIPAGPASTPKFAIFSENFK